VLWRGAENANLQDYHSYINYNADKSKWAQWWGGQWVRAGLPGYPAEGATDYTRQLNFLPDFRTESREAVKLPPFLKKKADTKAKEIPGATVRDYLVSWLTTWVRDYGVDGFRCDTVKNVEPESWAALKESASKALAEWKQHNPDKKIDDAPFWMVGEYWGQGVGGSPLYSSGFDALINFDFQGRLASTPNLDGLYQEYAKKLAGKPGYNVLSYVSSHDTRLFPRDRLIDGGTALLLAPGGVQIFYGDETARPFGPTVDSDAAQGTRSDMNWSSINQPVLNHWRKLGTFRAHHVALARGAHTKLADKPYTFSRVDAASGDAIVAATNARGELDIPVGTAFAEGSKLVDAYTGRETSVQGGKAHVTAEGVVLLEAKQ
jgi:alpha-amylase